MAEINLGNIQLISDGKRLTIARRDQPNMTITLDSDGVKELVDFISSLAETEFNRRRSFRVPVWPSSGLKVQLRKGEEQRVVQPKDISFAGIFVDLGEEDWLDLNRDDALEVILEFEGQTQVCRAVVRRRDLNGYGLLFPESMKGEQIDPPPGISRIVMELQRRWMATRAKGV